MTRSSEAIPLGSDGWHVPPASRSRSHTISNTQGIEDHKPAPDAALPTMPTRRPSFLSSAFGKLISSPTTYTASSNALVSPGESEATSSTGARTPPPGTAAPVLVVDEGDEHADELHDVVHDHYGMGLSRVLSGKSGQRRSSWSPSGENESTVYSASAPATGGVMAWLSSQQKEAAATSPVGQPPVGLFRRLSMSGSQKPPIIAADTATTRTTGFAVPERAVADTPMPADEAAQRLGRGMTRRGSNARRLSPMSERLLKGHYEF